MIERKPLLYTNETIVFKSRVEAARLEFPITVYEDSGGNHAVAHGNHRAYKAETRGLPLERQVIGKLPDNVSLDPYFLPVRELKVIDK